MYYAAGLPLFYVLGMGISLILAFIACRYWSDESLPVAQVTWAAFLISGVPFLAISAVIVYGLGFLALLGENQVLMASAIWVWLGAAVLCVLLGVPVAYDRVTYHWGRAIALAMIPVVVHLLCGWPQAFLWYALEPSLKPVIKQAEQLKKDLAKKAATSDLLQEYGLALPQGYRIVGVRLPDPDDRHDLSESWVDVEGSGELKSQRLAILESVRKSGYRLSHYKSYGMLNESYIKEPFVVNVSEPGQTGPHDTFLRIWLAREDPGEDFTRVFPDWHSAK